MRGPVEEAVERLEARGLGITGDGRIIALAIAKGADAIAGALGILSSDMDVIDERLTVLSSDFDTLNERLTAIDETLKSIDASVDQR